LQLIHCIVSSEAQFEIWWWPRTRPKHVVLAINTTPHY